MGFSCWGSTGFGSRQSSVRRFLSPWSSTATWRDEPSRSSESLDGDGRHVGGSHDDRRSDGEIATWLTRKMGGVSPPCPDRDFHLRRSRFPIFSDVFEHFDRARRYDAGGDRSIAH